MLIILCQIAFAYPHRKASEHFRFPDSCNPSQCCLDSDEGAGQNHDQKPCPAKNPDFTVPKIMSRIFLRSGFDGLCCGFRLRPGDCQRMAVQRFQGFVQCVILEQRSASRAKARFLCDQVSAVLAGFHDRLSFCLIKENGWIFVDGRNDLI